MTAQAAHSASTPLYAIHEPARVGIAVAVRAQVGAIENVSSEPDVAHVTGAAGCVLMAVEQSVKGVRGPDESRAT